MSNLLALSQLRSTRLTLKQERDRLESAVGSTASIEARLLLSQAVTKIEALEDRIIREAGGKPARR